MSATDLPPDFLAHLRLLEDEYLASDDPLLQSGFASGAERWRAEREPVLEAVTESGTFADVGCANGYLLECLVRWARERRISLTPYGVDIGQRLVSKARERIPEFAANIEAANAWDWRPKVRFRYVYTLSDCVPDDMLGPYVQRLLDRAVEPGGRLILGSYGSRSRGTPPRPVAGVLKTAGLAVAGSAVGGDPPVSAFAWADKKSVC